MTALPFGAAEATAAMHKTHKPKAHKVSMLYMDEYHPHGRPAIWAVRPNGKELHMVAYGLDAHISPDGKRIYCKCAKHGGIGVMKPDGSGLKRVGAGHQEFGSSYLYLSGVGTFVTAGSEQGEIAGDAIFVGPDSAAFESDLHAVYSVHESESGGYRYEKSVDIPFFSPDGRKIEFFENEQTTNHSCYEHQYKGCRYINRVDVINSDGSGLHTVTDQPAQAGLSMDTLFDPDVFDRLIDGLAGFSADGHSVLIYSPESDWGANVWTAAADGGLEHELNPLPRGGNSTTLSENGQRIAFTSFAKESSQRLGVFTIGVDGAGLRKVAPAAHGEHVTSWGKVVLPVRSRGH